MLKRGKMKNTQTWTIVVLAILLLAAAGYIGYGYYASYKTQQQTAYFNLGTQYGYTAAVSDLMNQAATCQAVPVTIGNQTLNMVAVECLQQQK